ncbi:MAG: SPFH domain-containing protein, partial [Bacteroides sp.]|nr:SPFH domain-containing protein [Bacteroides sp.]
MGVSNKSTVKMGATGVAVIGVIVLFLVMFAVERIDSGQTGIIVNLAGSERGLDDAKVETG